MKRYYRIWIGVGVLGLTMWACFALFVTYIFYSQQVTATSAMAKNGGTAAQSNQTLALTFRTTSALQGMTVASPTLESLLQPISAKSPQLDALREATFLLGEGDRLRQNGKKVEARVRWEAAAKKYTEAGDQLGAADAYLRLADSYQIEAIFSTQKRRLAITNYLAALTAGAEVYEKLIQKELKYDQAAIQRANTLYQQGVKAQETGNCSQALPLLEEAKKIYRQENFGSGEVRALTTEAVCQLEAKDYVGSLTTLLEGLLIAQSLPLGTPVTERYLQAKAQYEQGDLQGALTTYQEVLKAYQENHDQDGLAQTMHELGNVYARLGNYPEAEKWYKQALPLFISLKNDYSQYNEAATRHNLGNLATLDGRYDEAFSQYRQALQLWQAIGDPVREVTSLSGLGLALRGQGKYNEAREVLEKAWAQQQRLPPNAETEGDILNNLGYVAYSQGDYAQALDLFDQALQQRHQLPQRQRAQKETETLNNRAAVQASLGRFNDALATYQQVLDQLSTAGTAVATAHVRANVATVYIERGDYQRGIATYLELLPIFAQNNLHGEATAIRQNLGAAYVKIGDLAQAERYFQEALKDFTAAGDQASVATIRNNLGLLAAQAGRFDHAATDLEQALGIWQRLDNPLAAAKALGNLALIAAAQDKLSLAVQRGEEALRLSKQADVQSDQARLLITLSLIHLKLGKSAAAVENGQQALAVATQLDDPVTQMGSHLVLGMAHLAVNEVTLAGQEVQTTLDLLEKLQGALTVTELKTAFLGQLADVYDLAVLVALANQQPDQAFLYTEQARARAFLDQLGNQHIDFRQGADVGLIQQEQALRQRMVKLQADRNAEKARPLDQQRQALLATLESELEAARGDYAQLLVRLKVANPEYTTLVSVDDLLISEIQRQVVDAQTTLIVYFTPSEIISGTTLAWVIDQESVHLVPLAVGQAKLKQQIGFLRQLIAQRTFKPQDSADLYSHLFAPLKPYIRQPNLVIVPHGELHYLPFAALWNTIDKHYLAEEYPLTFAPSASTLRFIQQKHNPNTQRLLALGNPDSSLPKAEAEVKAVGQLYQTQPFLQKEATESQIYAHADQADILHLAAHGVYAQFNPLFTRIELAPDATNDGNLEVHEVYGLDLSNANLVVLSACETALGEQSHGDEIIGLTRAFLYAGTPSVITTLWTIDDAASATLLEEFYHNLQQGKTTAAALQTAQVAVMANEQWRSPYYWAAFSLIGDYRGGEQ